MSAPMVSTPEAARGQYAPAVTVDVALDALTFAAGEEAHARSGGRWRSEALWMTERMAWKAAIAQAVTR